MSIDKRELNPKDKISYTHTLTVMAVMEGIERFDYLGDRLDLAQLGMMRAVLMEYLHLP